MFWPPQRAMILALGVCVGLEFASRCALAQSEAPLPSGVKAVWNPDKAFRQKTLTRERVCLNGLWRWQPAREVADAVPLEQWGYFKVPGFWPGTSNYIQEDSQTLHVHPSWKN